MNKYTYWIVGLAVLLLFAVWQVFTLMSENEAIKNSKEQLLEQLISIEEENIRYIDSLAIQKQVYRLRFEAYIEEITELKNERNIKGPYYDKNVDSLVDPVHSTYVDSLFARYYPRTEAGGN